MQFLFTAKQLPVVMILSDAIAPFFILFPQNSVLQDPLSIGLFPIKAIVPKSQKNYVIILIPNKSPCKLIAPQIIRADLAWGFICISIGCPVRGEMLAFVS